MGQLPVLMGRRSLLGVGALLAGVGLGQTVEAAVTEADLKRYQWHRRVLLVFASRADDPLLIQQRAILQDTSSMAGERDLVLVEAVGHDAAAAGLRRRFGAGPEGFRAVLIGLDGGAKLASSDPIPAERLAEVIDAMPMRRAGPATQGTSKPVPEKGE